MTDIIRNCLIKKNKKKTFSVVNSKLEGQTKTVLKLDKMSQPMTGNFYKGVQIDFKLF